MEHTATYSPEDNKLRLYPAHRLDPEVYARVKAAGFGWAPKQELFVAPMWTPYREDFLIAMCGEIGDEDKSLMERAEERADRFEGISERRKDDADHAHDAVRKICDGIPFGQPILVGHHSEKRARKDAERIDDGMRKAVKMWEQSAYWADRATSAIRHAKYKENPAVRARRIKGLESDKRKQERRLEDAERCLKFWRGEMMFTNKETGEKRSLTRETAIFFCNLYDHTSKEFKLAEYPRQSPASQYEGSMSLWSALGGSDGPEFAIITLDQAKEIALSVHTSELNYAGRWLQHYENRLTYERAMLADGGGLAADSYAFEVGGRALSRGEWATITRVNRKDGRVCSVRTNAKYCGLWNVEDIKGYEPPTIEQAAATKAAVKLAPLCNFPSEGFREKTKAEIAGRSSFWIQEFPAKGEFGAYRAQSMFKGGSGLDCHDRVQVFVTDSKVKYPPKPVPDTTAANVPIITPARKALPVAKTLDDLHAAMFSHSEETGKIRAGIKYEYSGEGIAECYQFDSLDDLKAYARATEKQPRMVRFEIVTHTGRYQNMRTLYKWSAEESNKLQFNQDVQFAEATPAGIAKFAAMREQIKQGVKVVIAPQLFPTPASVAAVMVELANIRPGMCVLEPSAGTGNIAAMIREVQAHYTAANEAATYLTCVEINCNLAVQLSRFGYHVKQADFLECNENLGKFDRVLMNPPFENGADIKHIEHAIRFLKPGGRIVAICADGPRQNDKLKPIIEKYEGSWERLPVDTFKDQGTGVNTVMLAFSLPE